ncbi:uncharacterized protein LOC135931312 [Gordionus sp. m RMFG-2023]|uniref:uncharacterized protein LOC135931312 n=1 Tax=Gordionus sp. m RMFG-2023 TaxID=3053472 RepID=UPI0031FE142D
MLKESISDKLEITYHLSKIFVCKLLWEIPYSKNHVDKDFNVDTLFQLDKIFETQVEIDENTGIYYCSVKTISNSLKNMDISHHSLILPSLALHITMNGNDMDESSLLSNLRLSYHPPFRLEPNILFVSSDNTETYFKIISPSKNILFTIQFLPSESQSDFNIIEIIPPENQNRNIAIYTLKLNVKSKDYLLAEKDIAYTIYVYSPLSDQKENMLINIKNNGKNFMAHGTIKNCVKNELKAKSDLRFSGFFTFLYQDYQEWLYWLAIIAISIFCAIFAWFILYSELFQPTNYPFNPYWSPQKPSWGTPLRTDGNLHYKFSPSNVKANTQTRSQNYATIEAEPKNYNSNRSDTRLWSTTRKNFNNSANNILNLSKSFGSMLSPSKFASYDSDNDNY